MSPDQASMSEVVEQLPTKSAKIRALAKAGYARADIARFLDIRYQHVRNVLTQNAPRSEAETHSSNVTHTGLPGSTSVESMRGDLVTPPDGSITIDAQFARSADIKAGDAVLVRVIDGEIRISGYAASLRRAQWIAEHYHQPGRSEVDDFIAERRALAARGE